MFTWRRIGYPRDVEPDAADPPGQPAQQANERKGLRAFFSKDPAEESADSAGQQGTGNKRKAGATKTAPRSLRRGPGLLRGAGRPSAEFPAGGEIRDGAEIQAGAGIQTGAEVRVGAEVPAAPPGQRQRPIRPRHNRALANSLNSRPLTSRSLVNPHLRDDPRFRVWVTRAIIAVVILIGFTIGVNWRIGLTAAVIYIAADTILRSRTTAVVPASVRVTSAQRFTRRRLRVLHSSGYTALHARTIPGTKHVIDHLVVGPAGVFTLDSQRLDRRLPLRAIGGMLYHGKESMAPKFDHAQHEAKHAASLIAGELGQRVRVRPAMVLYGPSISWVIMQFKGVDVFDGSRVGTYFRRQTKAVARHRLTTSQIAMVLAAAAKALPPMQ
jgi:hypothetical protein